MIDQQNILKVMGIKNKDTRLIQGQNAINYCNDLNNKLKTMMGGNGNKNHTKTDHVKSSFDRN